MCMHIYIYIYRERDIERERDVSLHPEKSPYKSCVSSPLPSILISQRGENQCVVLKFKGFVEIMIIESIAYNTNLM